MVRHRRGVAISVGQDDLDVEDGLRLGEDRTWCEESDRQEN
jgi:hypothetical protein